MSYTVTDQRKQTMLKRIGEAAELIDDLRFLPFYRGVQIKLEKAGNAEEWQRMIETAKAKANPKRYFAKICKMVRDGTYKFIKKVAEVTGEAALFLHDKLVKYNFGKFQKYWVRKAHEFERMHGRAGFIELLEFAERKGISAQYMATALKNCKPPRQYYNQVVRSAAK